MFESSASTLSSISTVPSKVLDSMKMISETSLGAFFYQLFRYGMDARASVDLIPLSNESAHSPTIMPKPNL